MEHRFEEGEVVALVEDQRRLDLLAGDEGVIWALYDTTPPGYEVVFLCRDDQEFGMVCGEPELAERVPRRVIPLPSNPAYRIDPGEGIGPVRLGMTRGEVLKINPSITARPEGGRLDFPKTGLRAYLGVDDRVEKVEALVGSPLSSAALFYLGGQMVNGIGDRGVQSLFRTLFLHLDTTSELRWAGLVACKWQETDEFLHSLQVVPRTSLI